MACGDSASPLSPPMAAARDEVGTLGPRSEGASWAQSPLVLARRPWGFGIPGRSCSREPAVDRSLARPPAPPRRSRLHSSPPGRRKLVLASSPAAARPPAVRLGGPGADCLRSPSATPPCTAGLPDWVAVTAAPRSNFFPLYSLLKVEAWGREEKTQCRKGRCGLTCQRRRRKTPRSGRALEPAQGPEPWVRAERRRRRRRQCLSQVSPLGRARAAAPAPSPGRRAPRPIARDQGTPQLDFFVQFQQSSEEVGPFVPLFIDCVNIAKRRRRSGGPSPLPSSSRLLGEKSPSTRPKYTARQPPARPRPPARRLPLLPARARALPTPSRARPGKPAPRGSAPPTRLRGGGRLPQLCAWLVGSSQ